MSLTNGTGHDNLRRVNRAHIVKQVGFNCSRVERANMNKNKGLINYRNIAD